MIHHQCPTGGDSSPPWDLKGLNYNTSTCPTMDKEAFQYPFLGRQNSSTAWMNQVFFMSQPPNHDGKSGKPLDGLIMISGKPCLPRSLFEMMAKLSHGPCHVSRGGMVEIVERHFHAPGFNNYSKKFVESV